MEPEPGAQACRTAGSRLIFRIQKAHAGWIEFVEVVSDLELERLGRHPIGRTLSVKQMVQTHALHQVQHIRELAAALDQF